MKKYYKDDFFKELIVDNFAGGGGASVGIELATGRPVDIAVNHDADAVAVHKVNHPCTQHYKEDVFAVDPEKVTDGRPVGIAWFSPDCKHFSKAKGGAPVEKKIRGLSWVIFRWAMSKVAPRCIFMENVEEIQTWGPLIEVDGKMRPDPSRAGETFNGFMAMLTTGISKDHPAFAEACEFLKISPDSMQAERLAKGLGYKAEWKILRACGYGAPTLRKRFYMVARRDGQPIVFPKYTHGEGKGLKPYKTAADCIDWSIPCPSIFGRKKELAVNTLRRIARGLDIMLLTDEIVEILSRIKWDKYIRFSCDKEYQLPYFEKMVGLFNKYNIPLSKVFIYVLIQKDLDNADRRVQGLYKLSKSFNLYAQAERNELLGVRPNKLQLEFAQRYVYGRSYKKESWREYKTRYGI